MFPTQDSSSRRLQQLIAQNTQYHEKKASEKAAAERAAAEKAAAEWEAEDLLVSKQGGTLLMMLHHPEAYRRYKEKAKAAKWYAEAQELAPDEIKIQEKILKLQKEAISMEKTKADIANKNSETARNIPEVDHLRSETALNMAKAREAASKVNIQGTVQ